MATTIEQRNGPTCGTADKRLLPSRVLCVIDNLKPGGTASLALRIIRHLREAGVDVRLVSLCHSRAEGDWHDLPPVEYLDFHGDYRRPFAIRCCAKRLRRVIRNVQPDLLYSFLWLSDVVTATANRDAELPHLVHIVDRRGWQNSRQWKHRYRRWVTRRAFTGSNCRFLAVSNAAAQFAIDSLRLDPNRVGVAHNSIDCDELLEMEESTAWTGAETSAAVVRSLRERLPESSAHGVSRLRGGPPAAGPQNRKEIVLGIAGRLEPEKGHTNLFQAVAKLLKKDVSVRVLVTGDGSIAEQLRQEVRELGIEDQVDFLGWLSDVHEFWRQIDLFMVPSINSEGLPTTILEAMAAGRVVIASDIGGANEAIRDGVDGLIVPPCDVNSLVHAVQRLLQDRSRVRGMCRSARQRVANHFATPKMMQTILDCYGSMLAPIDHP